MRKLRKRRIPTMRQFLNIGATLHGLERYLFFIASFTFIISLVWIGNVLSNQYRVQVPAVKGSYIEGVIGTPQLINPLFSSLNDVDQDLVRVIYSGLLRYDAERRLVPDLAASYEVNEDGTVYSFKLKQDVVWHDGVKFTARDVAYTLESILDASIGSPLAISFQGVSVEVPDDYTVIFRLAESYSSFLQSLTTGILPEHIWSQIPTDQFRLAQRNIQPIGTGPYMFNRLVKDDAGFVHRIELHRFEQYYRTPPYIKDFSFIFFNEYEGPTGIITALREQEIDGMNFVPFEYREKVKRKQTVLKTLHLPQYTALFFNLKKDNLADKDVRNSLKNVLDKQRIVSDILENEAQVISGPILEGFPGYDSAAGVYTPSIDDANTALDDDWERLNAQDYRELLKEKMFKEYESSQPVESINETAEETLEETNEVVTSTVADVDESAVEYEKIINAQLDQSLDEAQLFYRYKKGNANKTEIFELKLVTAATPEYTQVAELVAGYWQDLGVKVTVELVDSKDLTRQVLKNREYDVLLYGVIIGSDPDQYPFWHSSQAQYPGLNLSGYENRTIDDILTSIRTEQDTVKLTESYSQLQSKILEDTPAVFLYTPTYTYLLSSEIQGFGVERISHPSDRFANITEWYVANKNIWKWRR